MTDVLNGKDFVALVRLSDPEDRTIAEVGQTCERVPAAARGGSAADALAYLLASHLIAPVTPAAPAPAPAAVAAAQPDAMIAAEPSPAPEPIVAAPPADPAQKDGDA